MYLFKIYIVTVYTPIFHLETTGVAKATGEKNKHLKLTLPVYIVDNVGVFQLLHHQDLIDDQLFLGLLLEVNLFNGHLEIREKTENYQEIEGYNLCLLNQRNENGGLRSFHATHGHTCL